MRFVEGLFLAAFDFECPFLSDQSLELLSRDTETADFGAELFQECRLQPVIAQALEKIKKN